MLGPPNNYNITKFQKVGKKSMTLSTLDIVFLRSAEKEKS